MTATGEVLSSLPAGQAELLCLLLDVLVVKGCALLSGRLLTWYGPSLTQAARTLPALLHR